MNDWKMTGEKLGGIGRTTVFQLWANGTLASVQIGTRRFSTDKQITDYITRLENGVA